MIQLKKSANIVSAITRQKEKKRFDEPSGQDSCCRS